MFCSKCQKFQPLFDVKRYCQLSICLILAGRLELSVITLINFYTGELTCMCGGRSVHFLLISFISLHEFAFLASF